MQELSDIDDSLQMILNVLADGQFHSGQELGAKLGVSRAAVWKQAQKLQAFGLQVHSVKGRGYRLAGELELLSAQEIAAQLDSEAHQLLSQLDIHRVIDSTNTEAVRQVRASGYVCLAEYQAAGRGRRGRTWISAFGKNIYLSVVWIFAGGAAELEGLSLAVGVAIAETLTDIGIEDIQLKWPNDVLWQGKKLAGILLEMTGDPAGECQVVIGIGINLQLPSQIAAQIDQPWTDLQSIIRQSGNMDIEIKRNILIARLLSKLLPLLHSFGKDRFLAYRERWESLHAFSGLDVRLRTANTVINGRIKGVTETGALRVDTATGEEIFYGGEISVRLA